MYIKDISLKDFRNYRELKTSFSDKVNIFIGNNAQGKTNLLESIYMNAMAKSFKKYKRPGAYKIWRGSLQDRKHGIYRRRGSHN